MVFHDCLLEDSYTRKPDKSKRKDSQSCKKKYLLEMKLTAENFGPDKGCHI
ncbi:hypothetical protein LEP1GSC058_0029 [Leptospira fainei serovar Hurstbridge str. BUT 6]|uniref:Uncharacterized protein n=1 Tax=Leptospira fainei serovar Hurstbridge str. BUT 6 TaxID=1193011 RepID=S3V0S4_9LEPT|nr:hypothetical protein LEP1GSC058_0029 [Leptospira fainei serovar Hurstbridge str. BUT 6]